VYQTITVSLRHDHGFMILPAATFGDIQGDIRLLSTYYASHHSVVSTISTPEAINYIALTPLVNKWITYLLSPPHSFLFQRHWLVSANPRLYCTTLILTACSPHICLHTYHNTTFTPTFRVFEISGNQSCPPIGLSLSFSSPHLL
jgi:hypothetical protein